MNHFDLTPLTHQNLKADFITRIADAQTSTDKIYALEQLRPHHDLAVQKLGYSQNDLRLAEQIHGSDIAEVTHDSPPLSSGVDGLMTNIPGLLLGIHVADCGAIYLADPVQNAIALLHSGKKGTELNILGQAVGKMTSNYGTNPKDLIAVLAPCIRPPHYEIDFAATINEQALEAGILPKNYHDCRICTASNLSTYYSYRLEKGNTGRMLALLGISKNDR